MLAILIGLLNDSKLKFYFIKTELLIYIFVPM